MNINDKVMALIKCSECGHMISDKARKCPKCGCPLALLEITIKDEESDQKVPSWPTIEYEANFNEGLNSIGGKIIITATQLIFRAHDFNFGDLRDRVYEIRDIVSYKKGILTFMYISFSDGKTIRLTVWDKQRIIDELEARRQSLI